MIAWWWLVVAGAGGFIVGVLSVFAWLMYAMGEFDE